MKICPKCNTGNNDNAIQCKDCGYSLTKVSIEKYQDYVQKIEEKNQKKHRIKMLVHNVLLVIFGVLYIYFYIKALSKLDFFQLTIIAVILPVISYLSIHHPRALFILGHFTTIDNIDDVELSDWYIFSSKIGGIACAIAGFIIMVMINVLE